MAVRRIRGAHASPTRHRTGVALGVALVVLGATFAVTAVARSRSLGVAGGAVGVLAGLWATGGYGTDHRRCHADLTLGAVSAHRLLEGLAIGALYASGTAVGLFGAAVVAGHTAVETAAVGGVYAAGPHRSRAVAAILLVQAGYAGGAIAGLGVSDVLPASTMAFALAVAGGALLVAGAVATGRSFLTRPRTPSG